MNLLKTSFYTSISTAITFLAGFIVIKVVAVKIGPEGIALIGQFQNTTSILTMIATGAITVGIVKYLAQYKDDPVMVRQVINTSFTIAFFSSLIISVLVMAFSKPLSVASFKTADFWLVYFLFGLFVMLVAFNTIFLAILNGLKEIRKFTIVNITTSITGVVFTALASYFLGLIGVLVCSTATAFCIFFLNLYIFRKLGVENVHPLKRFNKTVAKKLARYSLMAIVSGLVLPTMQIMVRDKIIIQFSTTEAGFWQAVTKISDYYLSFISSVLAVYYMPRLAEINTKSELRKEIFNGYKLILPVVGLLAFSIWVCRDMIVHLLFTAEFLPMKPLFTFQLLGDFFKIGSWLLAYLMLARAMIKTYIITEVLFAALYVLLSYIFIDRFGIIGATYSFCINYAIYWIVMFFIMRKQFK